MLFTNNTSEFPDTRKSIGFLRHPDAVASTLSIPHPLYKPHENLQKYER